MSSAKSGSMGTGTPKVERHNHEWSNLINRKADADTARRQTFQEGMKDYSKEHAETGWVTEGTSETGITKTIAGGPAMRANVDRLNRKIQKDRELEDNPYADYPHMKAVNEERNRYRRKVYPPPFTKGKPRFED